MSVSGKDREADQGLGQPRSRGTHARAKQEAGSDHDSLTPLISTAKSWAFLPDEWVANAATRNVDGKAALKFYLDTVKELSK
jgi:hypothetical protein